MKRIIIIENDRELNEIRHNTLLKTLREWKVKNPIHEVIILTSLGSYGNKELFSKISQVDAILCMPTFTDQSQVIGIVSLLGKISTSLDIHIISYDVEESLIKICTPEQLYNVRHHKVYKSYYEDEQLLNFSKIWKPYEDKKIVEQQYIASRKTAFTGRKIKIKDVQGNNSEFQNLKVGEILDELDCREIDPNPKRGVWVWGINEPVKLLNDSGYDEFEIVDEHNSQIEITLEEMMELIRKSTGQFEEDEPLDKDQRNFLIDLLTENMTNQDKAWEVVDFFEMERRGNRQMFLQMFNKYKPKSLEKVA